MNQLYIYICSHISSLLHLPPSHPPYPTPLGGHKAPSCIAQGDQLGEFSLFNAVKLRISVLVCIANIVATLDEAKYISFRNYKRSENLSYLQAKKLACHSFMDAERRTHDPWVRDREFCSPGHSRQHELHVCVSSPRPPSSAG